MADTPQPGSLQPSPEAEALFHAMQERWYGGEDVDFEALCRAHPAHEAGLRQLNAQWRRVLHLLDQLPLPGSLTDRLQQTFGANIDPKIALDAQSPDSVPSSQLLRRLATQPPGETRYVVQNEIARGGMGTILRVWDDEFRRNLAMKVVHAQAPGKGAASGAQANLGKLVRFLEEAQITGQLDHPGVVPVHELGLDQEGRLYFTMRLVKGRTLKEIFDLVHAGQEGWTRTRALHVMQRVCETMAYAHSKNVIHRDLKPANIMVGRFGETYVMDWGLARVVGYDDHHDLRLRDVALASQTAIHTERDDLRDTADSPLMTMDGDIVGTPSYMAPEQAAGRVHEVGPRADVYSVGAMLYHLLTGQLPYWPPGTRMSPHTVLGLVVQGPPKPIHALDAEVPVELVAICERAMAREPADRYADMGEMAEDLRAFLEHRVVRAYETGAFAELRKWVVRNKSVALATAAAILLALMGMGGIAYVRSVKEAEVLRLSDSHLVRELVRDAEKLWPEWPAKVEDMKAWLARAAALESRLPRHRQTLARWRERGELDAARAVESVALASERKPAWRFATNEEQWRHDTLAELVTSLEQLADPDPRVGLIADVKARLSEAESVEMRTLAGDRATAWDDVCAALEKDARYDNLRLEAQVGFVPLGQDPESQLFEFAMPRTGAIPERNSDGHLAMHEDSALVFVLIPGGSFLMGAQSKHPDEPNYDPLARDNIDPIEESPVTSVPLAPFFISKYEMTQGQWQHVTGSNPSTFRDRKALTKPYLLHPVEGVSWNEAARVLDHLGLVLPTEAQWECAARAGTSTPWWTGRNKSDLPTAANLFDQSGSKSDPSSVQIETWDDHYQVHAPVGSFRPNAFGLHDVIGNVFEWCRDAFASYTIPPDPGDGERHPTNDEGLRSARGGAFDFNAANSRVSMRFYNKPDHRHDSLGLRPARRIGDSLN
ncbi:MAG: bifunctional serine/threonine-protein kinase/formylglycine-generating enzyme family protein [Planctomycetota bacterium]